MAKSKKGIELSPKHGLNPCLETCFWCGESMGVALMGRVREKKGDKTDLEAPREMVFSLEPCEECKKKFAQGVHLIEVTEDGGRFNCNERFAIKDTNGNMHWPTGRYAVLKPSAIRDGKAGGKALCDKATMDRVLGVGEDAK